MTNITISQVRLDELLATEAAYHALTSPGVPERARRLKSVGNKASEGDPEALWASRLRSLFGDNPPARVLALHDTILDLVGSPALVKRELRGRPGWTIAGVFVSLDDVVECSEKALEDLVAATVAKASPEVREQVESGDIYLGVPERAARILAAREARLEAERAAGRMPADLTPLNLGRAM